MFRVNSRLLTNANNILGRVVIQQQRLNVNASIVATSISNNSNSRLTTGLFTTTTNNYNGLVQQIVHYSMKQRIGRRVKPNIFIQSPGQLFENQPPTPITTALLKPTTWIDTVKYYYRTYASITLIKGKLKTLTSEAFKMKTFLEEAKELFIELNESMADGDVDAVKDLTTVYYYSTSQRTTKFELNNNKNINTEWTVDLNKPKLVWCRAGQIKTSLSGDTEYFAQICLEFSGKQSLKRTDVKKNTVISENNGIEFKDRYVFERCISSLPSQWKICQSVQIDN